MAKKTRKVLKQESQQRAIQQAQTNVNTVNNAPAAAEPVKAAVPKWAAKTEPVSPMQDFLYVKSDVRTSLTLAAVLIVAMFLLSFVVR